MNFNNLILYYHKNKIANIINITKPKGVILTHAYVSRVEDKYKALCGLQDSQEIRFNVDVDGNKKFSVRFTLTVDKVTCYDCKTSTSWPIWCLSKHDI